MSTTQQPALVERYCFHCGNFVLVPFPDISKDDDEIHCEYCE